MVLSRAKRYSRIPDLVHELEALQFEVGSQQQTAIELEHPCLSHKSRHPILEKN